MAKKLYIIAGYAHIYVAYYDPMRQQLTSPSGGTAFIFLLTKGNLVKSKLFPRQ